MTPKAKATVGFQRPPLYRWRSFGEGRISFGDRGLSARAEVDFGSGRRPFVLMCWQPGIEDSGDG